MVEEKILEGKVDKLTNQGKHLLHLFKKAIKASVIDGVQNLLVQQQIAEANSQRAKRIIAIVAIALA